MVPVSEISTPGDTEMIRTTIRDASYYIAKQTTFNASAMSADFFIVTDGMPQWGQLDGEDLDQLRHDLETHKILYVVYSYATPIAWGPVGSPLYVPDAHYSATTTKHQNICRKA
jgi:hypothetical protein